VPGLKGVFVDFVSFFVPVINSAEYKDLAMLIREQAGIDLGVAKKDLVKARLAGRMKQHGFKTFREYHDYVIHDHSGDELVELINAISTNVTSFFREDRHFAYLKTHILPELVERNQKERKIRIWSAACSSGEEVYSILMTIAEFFNGLFGWDFKVLGTDISTKVLSLAQKGVYTIDKMKGIPPLWLQKYFIPIERDGKICYRVIDKLLERAIFLRLNLLMEKYPLHHKADVIFCRNVMIYFDKETRRRVVAQLCETLHDEGYLLVGHSEGLIGMRDGLASMAPSVYKKTAEARRP
jgi:chemotaxis protein methyltransferase CheR